MLNGQAGCTTSVQPFNLPPVHNQHQFEQILQDLLAPLTPESFQSVIGQVKQNVRFLNQILALLEDQSFEGILQKMLRAVALKLGELLDADRTTIFLLDEQQQELWSLLAQKEGGKPFEIRIPADKGIAGHVAQNRFAINIPYDFYDDPRSETAKLLDQQTGYRTYSLLTLPLLEPTGEVLAVVQLLNKLCPDAPETAPLDHKIDRRGFSSQDEKIFAEFSEAIGLLLKSTQGFYQASRKQRAAAALMRTSTYLSGASLDLSSTLERVLDEAKQLIFAQKSDLWLLDSENQQLWRPLPDVSAEPEKPKQRLPLNSGLLGVVATSGKPMRLNGVMADRALHLELGLQQPVYNVLCMPLFDYQDKLIGVTLLCNKFQQTHQSQMDAQLIPVSLRTHFDQVDETFMAAFNRQAGIALEKSLLFEEMERTIAARTHDLEQKNQLLHQEVLERKRVEVMLQQTNLKLEELAQVDGLTQICNRRQFDHVYAQEWKRMRREGQPLSLVLCDIDHFKQFNDTYGHPAGDRCLYQVAQAIRQAIKRPADFVARYGGEEFVMLLPNTPSTGAMHLAQIVNESVEALGIEHCASSASEVVTLSLGVATIVPTHENSQCLIEQADKALYQAKKRGRNQAVRSEAQDLFTPNSI